MNQDVESHGRETARMEGGGPAPNGSKTSPRATVQGENMRQSGREALRMLTCQDKVKQELRHTAKGRDREGCHGGRRSVMSQQPQLIPRVPRAQSDRWLTLVSVYSQAFTLL